METAVKEELQLFLNSRMSAESMSCLDDIVLGYIVSVLKQLGEDDHFDIDEIISIMDAYLPGFEQVNRDDVYSWMLLLVDKLAKATNTTYCEGHDQDVHADESVSDEYDKDRCSLKIEPEFQIKHESADEPTRSCENDLSMRLEEMNCKYGASPDHKNLEHLDMTKESKSTSPITRFAEPMKLLTELFPDVSIEKIHKCIETVHGNPEDAIDILLKELENQTIVNRTGEKMSFSTEQSECNKSRHKDNIEVSPTPSTSFTENVSLLKEMFPEACTLQVKKCLLVASGDPEAAVQLMLYNEEISEENATDAYQHIQALTVKAHQPSSKKQQLEAKDNKCLKEQLMARYGYVDTSEEEKTHQPVLLKQEQKKLIRYRNNQVVSTKGERYSLVKQEESEDLKKTYINLKPARKYRFH